MNDQILRKIKRCMDLSSSSNEHEAAMAIKQMQILMQKHGFNEKHILAADVTEDATEIEVRKKPAKWVLQLHQTIAQALDCASIVRSWENYYNIQLIFIGVGSTPEIANYAFKVLHRQLKRNRAEYISENLNRFKRSNKTKLADAYCAGWVSNVRAKVKNLDPNLGVKKKVKAYQETKLKDFNPEKFFEGAVQRFDKDDFKVQKAMHDGFREAKDVNLFVATEHQDKKQIGGVV